MQKIFKFQLFMENSMKTNISMQKIFIKFLWRIPWRQIFPCRKSSNFEFSWRIPLRQIISCRKSSSNWICRCTGLQLHESLKKKSGEIPNKFNREMKSPRLEWVPVPRRVFREWLGKLLSKLLRGGREREKCRPKNEWVPSITGLGLCVSLPRPLPSDTLTLFLLFLSPAFSPLIQSILSITIAFPFPFFRFLFAHSTVLYAYTVHQYTFARMGWDTPPDAVGWAR